MPRLAPVLKRSKTVSDVRPEKYDDGKVRRRGILERFFRSISKLGKRKPNRLRSASQNLESVKSASGASESQCPSHLPNQTSSLINGIQNGNRKNRESAGSDSSSTGYVSEGSSRRLHSTSTNGPAPSIDLEKENKLASKKAARKSTILLNQKNNENDSVSSDHHDHDDPNGIRRTVESIMGGSTFSRRDGTKGKSGVARVPLNPYRARRSSDTDLDQNDTDLNTDEEPASSQYSESEGDPTTSADTDSLYSSGSTCSLSTEDDSYRSNDRRTHHRSRANKSDSSGGDNSPQRTRRSPARKSGTKSRTRSSQQSSSTSRIQRAMSARELGMQGSRSGQQSRTAALSSASPALRARIRRLELGETIDAEPRSKSTSSKPLRAPQRSQSTTTCSKSISSATKNSTTNCKTSKSKGDSAAAAAAAAAAASVGGGGGTTPGTGGVTGVGVCGGSPASNGAVRAIAKRIQASVSSSTSGHHSSSGSGHDNGKSGSESPDLNLYTSIGIRRSQSMAVPTMTTPTTTPNINKNNNNKTGCGRSRSVLEKFAPKLELESSSGGEYNGSIGMLEPVDMPNEKLEKPVSLRRTQSTRVLDLAASLFKPGDEITTENISSPQQEPKARKLPTRAQTMRLNSPMSNGRRKSNDSFIRELLDLAKADDNKDDESVGSSVKKTCDFKAQISMASNKIARRKTESQEVVELEKPKPLQDRKKRPRTVGALPSAAQRDKERQQGSSISATDSLDPFVSEILASKQVPVAVKQKIREECWSLFNDPKTPKGVKQCILNTMMAKSQTE